MARLASLFLLGVFCGAVIVGVGGWRDQAAPAQAAQINKARWKTKVFPEGFVIAADDVPFEPDLYINHFFMGLGASCVIELSGDEVSLVRGSEPGILLYACP